MGILSRMVDLCKADLHGVMDQIEDKELLLKQHLRDMASAISENEERLRFLNDKQRKTESSREMLAKEIQKTDADATMAIEKHKDDIARMLIRKVHPMKRCYSDMSHNVEEIRQQISRLADTIQVQRMEYEKIKLSTSALLLKTQLSGKRYSLNESPTSGWNAEELTGEEVELELMQRKDKIFGGNANE